MARFGYETRTSTARELGSRVAHDEQTYQVSKVVVRCPDARQLLVRTWKVDPATYDSAQVGRVKAAQQQSPRPARRLANSPELITCLLSHVCISLAVSSRGAFVNWAAQLEEEAVGRRCARGRAVAERTAS